MIRKLKNHCLYATTLAVTVVVFIKLGGVQKNGLQNARVLPTPATALATGRSGGFLYGLL